MSAVLEAHEPSARYMPSAQPVLVRQFELLATAPDGVARLRNLIVSLAVRGGLSQREPADATLASDVTSDGDAPYELPQGWRWQRLGELQPEFQNGAASRGDAGGQPTTVLRLADIRNRRVSLAATRTVPIRREDIEKFLLRDGDILITRVNGSADIVGQFNLVEGEPRAIYCDHFIRLRVNRQVLDPHYLALFASCDMVRMRIGDLFISTAGQKTVNQGHIASLPIAIPPMREQARIVARVGELMRLCDALEAKGRLEAELHARLLGTLLGTLTDSSTPEDLAANWQRVADHFDLLLDCPEAVDALEQTILQLAVRGLLVAQEWQDDSGSAQVQTEPWRLSRGRIDGKVRRGKELPAIEASEEYFDLPRGWQWLRLGEVADTLTGFAFRSADYTSRGTLVFRVSNINADGSVDLSDVKYIDVRAAVSTYKSFELAEGDLLMVMVGGSLGKIGIVDAACLPAVLNQNMWKVVPGPSIDSKFLLLTLLHINRHRLKVTASTHGHLAQGDYLKQVVALPPLAEQTRIVTRVTELRRLCADLRQRLAASQTTQAHLAEALVAEVA